LKPKAIHELMDKLEEAADQQASAEARRLTIEQHADAFLQKLKDESLQNHCTREQIERLFTFSPLPETPAARGLIAAAKSATEVDRDATLSELPKRLQLDEDEIERIKSELKQQSERLDQISASVEAFRANLDKVNASVAEARLSAQNAQDAVEALVKVSRTQDDSPKPSAPDNSAMDLRIEALAIAVESRRDEIRTARGEGRRTAHCRARQRQHDRADAKKNILKPHRKQQWVIPPDASAAFVAKLEVYQRPHDPQRPLVCLDETSKQLIIETRAPILPPRRRTNGLYRRKTLWPARCKALPGGQPVRLPPRAPLRRALTKPPRAAGMTSPSTPSQPHRPNRALPDANIIYSIRGYEASYVIISYSRPGADAAAGAPDWATQAGSVLAYRPGFIPLKFA
jgi:hypothetical protein